MQSPVVAVDARLVGGTSTGDSTYWTSLLSKLALAPSEFRFLLFTNTSTPPEIPGLLNERVLWRCLPSNNSRLWSLLTFPMAARKAGASVIHTQYSLSPFVGRRGITTIHDVSFFIGPEWFPARHRHLLQRTVPAAAKRAAAVITVSETSKGEIERYIPAAKGKTYATPLAAPDWIARQDPATAARFCKEEFGLEAPFLLTVSTRWARKNMQLAVKAVEALPSEFKATLAITGKQGWDDSTLLSCTKALGYVSNEALSYLYSAASIYLCPSLHEGFGIPLLEAMRCGCPVVAGKGGALPEVAGDAARIVPTYEVGDWTDAVQDLLNDSSKLDRLCERGFEREKEFSWEKTAQQTLEVYRKVSNL